MQTIDKLLAFLEVDSNTVATAEILSDILAPKLDDIIERFYENVLRYDISPALTADTIVTLKEKQKQHWLALFTSRFGPDYCASARRIAIRHRDIALNPRWYIAGYVQLKLAYTDVIMDSEFGPLTKRNLVETLEKYIAVDMALALSTYDAIVVS
jgi:hypothetical protein